MLEIWEWFPNIRNHSQIVGVIPKRRLGWAGASQAFLQCDKDKDLETYFHVSHLIWYYLRKGEQLIYETSCESDLWRPVWAEQEVKFDVGQQPGSHWLDLVFNDLYMYRDSQGHCQHSDIFRVTSDKGQRKQLDIGLSPVSPPAFVWNPYLTLAHATFVLELWHIVRSGGPHVRICPPLIMGFHNLSLGNISTDGRWRIWAHHATCTSGLKMY